MKKWIFLLSLLWLITMARAQNVTVTGKITDGNDPLIGVTVQVAGSKAGVVSDANGNYRIEVPVHSVVSFSYVGFTTVRKKVEPDTRVMDVVMYEDLQQMDEVVVTALDIRRNRRSLGYSTQEVSENDLNTGNETNLLNKLTGKLAGVQITAGNSGAGSSSRVIIRGESSFSNNNQPLYVVDGVPINNNTYAPLSGTPQEIDYGNGAGELNADDIASVTILKGANAAALYGSRAANGVVLITTKNGKGNEQLKIDFSSTTTFENVARLPEYQNKWSQGANGVFEYWDGANGKGTQDHQDMSWGRELDGSLVPQYDSPSVGPNGEVLRGGDVLARNGAAITPTPLVAYPDNVRDFFETGVTQNTHLALSANYSKGDFRLAYTNLYSKGSIPNVDLKRHTISFSSSYRFTDRFQGKATVNYVHSSSSNRPSTGYGPENPMYLFAWCARQMNIDAEREYWQR